MMTTPQDDEHYSQNSIAARPRIVSSLDTKTATASYNGPEQEETEEQRQLCASWKDKASKLHWILHFDINETILVGDEVGGDTTSDCYNKILAKSAFCQMMPKYNKPPPPPADERNNGNEKNPQNEYRKKDDTDYDFAYDYDHTSALSPTHWWDGSPIIITVPEPVSEKSESASESESEISASTKTKTKISTATTNSVPPPLYTGWQWPNGCCPYYRTSYKKISKTFVEHHGAIYKPIHEEMVRKLKAAEHPEAPIFHNLLPALFQTLYTLLHTTPQQQQQPQTAEYPKHPNNITIVFRTFGTDLPQIAQAMTAFARGQHPDYPDFVHPEYELPESNLFQAKWVPIDSNSNSNNDNNDKNDNKLSSIDSNSSPTELFQYQLYQLNDSTKLMAAGDQQVLDLLHNNNDNDNNRDQLFVYGIRDDYPMWKRHNWEPWAGKPVWITENYAPNHHHVLFDDNVHNLPHDGIASVRRKVDKTSTRKSTDNSNNNGDEIVLFESLPGPDIQSMQGLHLVRVPTIEPILNEHWFLEQFRKVQTAALRVREENQTIAQ